MSYKCYLWRIFGATYSVGPAQIGIAMLAAREGGGGDGRGRPSHLRQSEPSVGSKGDSYDNAQAKTINGGDKAELIQRRAP